MLCGCVLRVHCAGVSFAVFIIISNRVYQQNFRYISEIVQSADEFLCKAFVYIYVEVCVFVCVCVGRGVFFVGVGLGVRRQRVPWLLFPIHKSIFFRAIEAKMVKLMVEKLGA